MQNVIGSAEMSIASRHRKQRNHDLKGLQALETKRRCEVSLEYSLLETIKKT